MFDGEFFGGLYVRRSVSKLPARCGFSEGGESVKIERMGV